MRSKGLLETISNLVVIAVGLALAMMIGRNLWLSHVNSAPLAVGHKMHTVGDYDWKKHSQTLIIAVRNGCPYCNASKPFYTSILDKRDVGSLGADVLFVHLQPKEVADKEWSSYEDRALFAYKVPLQELGILGTPTLVLLDQTGYVKNIWSGQLDKASENDVLRTLAACSGCDRGL